MAAGDKLRVLYHGLSKDPNSLSNLDQDLPNYAQVGKVRGCHMSHATPCVWGGVGGGRRAWSAGRRLKDEEARASRACAAACSALSPPPLSQPIIRPTPPDSRPASHPAPRNRWASPSSACPRSGCGARRGAALTCARRCGLAPPPPPPPPPCSLSTQPNSPIFPPAHPTMCNQAKTIDLCNNPLTKEPKLQSARRIIAEWPDLDREAAEFTAAVARVQVGGWVGGVRGGEAQGERESRCVHAPAPQPALPNPPYLRARSAASGARSSCWPTRRDSASGWRPWWRARWWRAAARRAAAAPLRMTTRSCERTTGAAAHLSRDFILFQTQVKLIEREWD